jgi:photosystem I protein
MNNTEYTNDTPKAARFSDVVWGVGIFLAINLLVAAMYLKIVNP